MGFSEAVQWWDEWQLRVLVLSSLSLQYFLYVAAAFRKRRIPAWLRFSIWLAYLGSDAVAIYALATLFNRERKEEWTSVHRSSASLEALWAPILFVHLGGQDGITAYNIEDNELWRRHVLTAVSQVAVAIYVFCKSFSGDKRLLQAAILSFVCGIIKCLEKPWALKRASINSLVNTSSSSTDKSGKISSLDEYVEAVTKFFQANKIDGGERTEEPYNLFVDLAYPYSVRLENIKYMVLVHTQKEKQNIAHRVVQKVLSKTFDRFYTKEQVYDVRRMFNESMIAVLSCRFVFHLGGYLRSAIVYLSFAAIGLFHKSNREAHNHTDVKVTYILLCCTAALHLLMTNGLVLMIFRCCVCLLGLLPWPDQVAQYNLLGYLARNRKHRKLRKLATLLICKDYLDQLWCMKPCKSSSDITKLVHDHAVDGWKGHIRDAATYRAFNDNRGQLTLGREGREDLEWSLRRPFDESILLWHLATDFCFSQMGTPPDHQTARRCRKMSNYMVYLLFVNPEMLMAGARSSLFRDAYGELKKMSTVDKREPMLHKNKKPLNDKEMAQMIIQQVKGTQGPGFVRDAWTLAEALMGPGNEEEKTWRVIQDVWVEMLYFSAGRCRGYLHAKSLGKGGEYLSYVWLLLSYMGMETLAEKMQKTVAPTPTATGEENV